MGGEGEVGLFFRHWRIAVLRGECGEDAGIFFWMFQSDCFSGDGLELLWLSCGEDDMVVSQRKLGDVLHEKIISRNGLLCNQCGWRGDLVMQWCPLFGYKHSGHHKPRNCSLPIAERGRCGYCDL